MYETVLALLKLDPVVLPGWKSILKKSLFSGKKIKKKKKKKRKKKGKYSKVLKNNLQNLSRDLRIFKSTLKYLKALSSKGQ